MKLYNEDDYGRGWTLPSWAATTLIWMMVAMGGLIVLVILGLPITLMLLVAIGVYNLVRKNRRR